MQLKLDIGFDQLYELANQLPQSEKKKLIIALQKKDKKNKNKERQLGKYNGKVEMSKDFNEPLDDLKEYM